MPNSEDVLLEKYVSTIKEFHNAVEVNGDDTDLSEKKKEAVKAIENLEKIMRELIALT